MRSNQDIRTAGGPEGLWREGDYWALRFEGLEIRLHHTKGLTYIARLLQHPEREFHALDLYHLAELPPAGPFPANIDEGLNIDAGTGAGPALDRRAKEAYRARVDELRDELAEAERWNDTEKAARAKEELEALAEQMAEAVGLGGKDRPVASDAERARQNVGRAIRKAVDAIAVKMPTLGAHLERALKTGTFISYQPKPDPAFPYFHQAPSKEPVGAVNEAGRALPSGTATFLLTDIQGSTRLWEQHPKEMEAALAEHDRLVERAVDRHTGFLIKTKGEGDSTFSVFHRATDAISGALEAMLSLRADDFGLDLKVRMAIHTGEAELRAREYYGSSVNRCARMREIAYGGQILLSGPTHELVRDRLPEGAWIKDLGRHLLRDLERPEPIFQVVHPGLQEEFPPLRSMGVQPHNLPIQLTSFVGRHAEIEKISELFVQSRLVMLTGAGGSGKTRLAIESASQHMSVWPDGVWLVDLAPIFEPDYVPRALALALGVKETPRRPVIEDVIERIGDGRSLLIFDNCEHLLDPCADTVAALLRTCPQLKVLATSREPLGVMGEVTFRLGSLELAEENSPIEQITQADSVRLFADRAAASVTNFRLDANTAEPVSYICRRLDGLPLAIELAAARIKMFSVHDLAENLEGSFKLLSGGLRTSLPRHRTLEATVAWSYELLTEQQRALFDRLSVFSGGWSLDGALETLTNVGLGREAILDDLGSLIDKSLVTRDELPGGRVRYRMLETLRQYAGAKLAEAGKVAETRDAHLQWVRAMAQEVDSKIDGPEGAGACDMMEVDLDNVRSSLEWALASGQAELGFAIASIGHASFWLWRSHVPEGRSWLKRLLELPSETTLLRARALHGATRLAFQSGDYEEGVELAYQAAEMCRALGDGPGEARNLCYVAMCKWTNENDEEILEVLKSAAEVASRTEDSIANFLSLGLLALWWGPIDAGKARAFADQSEKWADSSGSLNWTAHSHEFKAHVGLFEGTLDEAADLLGRALPGYLELGNRSCGSHCLETVAALAAQRGELEEAAILLAAMEAERESIGSAPPAYERIGYERGCRLVKEGLDGDSLEIAWRRGKQLSYDEAADRALELLKAMK